MFKFGVLCPSVIGHLNPMSALACELKRRGREVVFLCLPDGARMLAAAGMDHHVIGEEDFPEGSIEQFNDQLGEIKRA